MPSTYSSNSGIELPANGEQAGTWGNVVNNNMNIIDRLTSSVGQIELTGVTYTLQTQQATLSDGHFPVILFYGTPGGVCTITISPDTGQHIYTVKNLTAFNIIFTQGSGAGGQVTLLPNETKTIASLGTGLGATTVSTVLDLTINQAFLSTTFGGAVFGQVAIYPTDSNIDQISYPLAISHQVTGTPAIGVGTGLILATETSNGNTEVGGSIESFATNVNLGTENFALGFRTMTNGAAMSERLRLFAVPSTSTRMEFTPESALTIVSNRTSDGTDTAALNICGGGDYQNTRGSTLFLNGNEAVNAGYVVLSAGNVTNAPVYIDAPNATGSIKFQTNGATRLNIDENGNTNIPDSAAGSTNYFSLGNSSDLRLYHDGSNSYIADAGTGGLKVLTGLYSLKNTADSQTMLTAAENGAVSLYNNDPLGPGVKLVTTKTGVAITGVLTTTGDITAFFTSDQRLKTNILHIENALEKMDQIGGYTYDWLPESGKEGSTVGVLAQELQTVLPEAVALRDNGYLAVRYENIIPLLSEAIKELRQEVKILKGK